MKCPLCNIELEQLMLAGVGVDYCSKCYGLWFEEDELRLAKDEKDRELRWVDIELWKDTSKFRLSVANRMCPVDRLPLYEVGYGDSNIKVDVCNLCHGIWLDRGEFKSIIAYIRERADHGVLYHYSKDLFEELWEVFSGPEVLREEILDFLTILKLLMYKFAVQHSTFSRIIVALPR